MTMRHVLSGRGSSRARADRIPRSGQVGRGLLAWRPSTATSCRNTSTSAINTVLLPASSISHPSTRTVSKYKRRNATGGDHAGVPLVTKRQVTAAASSSGTVQGALLGEVETAFVEHAQHRGCILVGHRRGIALKRGDAGSRRGIQGVGLAAAATREFPHPRGRCGGTSATDSPRATSHCARCRPKPRAFSTAQRRWSNRFAQANSRRYSFSVASTRTVSSTVWRSRSSAAAVWLDLCGSIPITIVNRGLFP